MRNSSASNIRYEEEDRKEDLRKRISSFSKGHLASPDPPRKNTISLAEMDITVDFAKLDKNSDTAVCVGVPTIEMKSIKKLARLETVNAAKSAGNSISTITTSPALLSPILHIESGSTMNSSIRLASRRDREIAVVVDPDTWESLFLVGFIFLMGLGMFITKNYVPKKQLEDSLLFKRLGYSTSCLNLDFKPVTLFSSAIYVLLITLAVTAIIMRLARAVTLKKLGKMSDAANIYFWITAFVEVLGYSVFSLCLSVHPEDNIYIHVLGFCFFIFSISICSSIRNVIWRVYFGLERSRLYHILMNVWYSLYVVVSIFGMLCLGTLPFYEHPPFKSITRFVDITWSMMFLSTIFLNQYEGYGNGFLKISFEFIDQDHPDFNDDIKLFVYADGHLDKEDIDDFNRELEETSINDMLMQYCPSCFWFMFFLGLYGMSKASPYAGCKVIDYLPGWNVFQYFIQLGTVLAGLNMGLVYLPSFWRLLYRDQPETEHKFSKYFVVPGGVVFALGNGFLAFLRLVHHTIPTTSTVYGFGTCTFMQLVGLTFTIGFIYHQNFVKYSLAQRWAVYCFVSMVLITMFGRVIALLTGNFNRYYQGATGCPFSQFFG